MQITMQEILLKMQIKMHINQGKKSQTLLQNVPSVLIIDQHRGVHSLRHGEEDVHFKSKSFRMLFSKFCDQDYQQKNSFFKQK